MKKLDQIEETVSETSGVSESSKRSKLPPIALTIPDGPDSVNKELIQMLNQKMDQMMAKFDKAQADTVARLERMERIMKKRRTRTNSEPDHIA